MEEVDDEDAVPSHKGRYVRDYPGRAGDVLGKSHTKFELRRAEMEDATEGKYTPFKDEEECGLAKWLLKNVGQKKIDEYLKLPIVSLLLLATV